jgi:DNA-directed RNA polymerase specialized sigma24 family protein
MIKKKKVIAPTFEESIDIVNSEIQKRKHRWHLTAIAWMDFEDVSQRLRIHIYKKWAKWDTDRPLRPWLNQVINHQMTNMLRNHYSNFSRPCLKCPFNTGDYGCSIFGTQNNDCKDYKKWEKSKKSAYDIKFPLSIHSPNHDNPETTLESVLHSTESNFNIEDLLPVFHDLMKKNLSNIEAKVYEYMFLQHLDDSEVAKKMGYKLSIKEGRPAYRQISKIKSRILQKAREIVKEVV